MNLLRNQGGGKWYYANTFLGNKNIDPGKFYMIQKIASYVELDMV